MTDPKVMTKNENLNKSFYKLLMTTFYYKIHTEEPKYVYNNIYLAPLHFEGEYLASQFFVITFGPVLTF